MSSLDCHGIEGEAACSNVDVDEVHDCRSPCRVETEGCAGQGILCDLATKNWVRQSVEPLAEESLEHFGHGNFVLDALAREQTRAKDDVTRLGLVGANVTISVGGSEISRVGDGHGRDGHYTTPGRDTVLYRLEKRQDLVVGPTGGSEWSREAVRKQVGVASEAKVDKLARLGQEEAHSLGEASGSGVGVGSNSDIGAAHDAESWVSLYGDFGSNSPSASASSQESIEEVRISILVGDDNLAIGEDNLVFEDLVHAQAEVV